MPDPRFEPENINPITNEAREAMCDLVLAWASYDSLVSQWAIVSLALPLDCGAIFLGNMDTRTKLDRLQSLFQHHELSGAKSIDSLRKKHLKHVGIRNSVCHAHCAGTLTSDPKRVVFAPVKAMKGEPGQMLVEGIHLDQMREATAFAQRAASNINRLVEAALSRRK